MGNARERRMTGINAGAVTVALLFAMVSMGTTPAVADDAMDARQLVERARLTFESFSSDATLGENLRVLVNKARGVLIYPQVFRGAFIFGGSGGSGVLLVQDAQNRKWAGPAFYTIGQVSFGLQIGADASEVVLVALTDRGVTALLSTSGKLGADASVAAGPIGVGLSGATANISADIVSWSRNKGLYAGLSLEGAIVAVRDSLNEAFYGRAVTPTQILIQREVSNPEGAKLIEAVAKVAGGS